MRATTSGFRSVMAKAALAGAFIAIPVAGMAGVPVPVDAAPGLVATSDTPAPFDDFNPDNAPCGLNPGGPDCGSGSDIPADPLDPGCAQMSWLTACAGSPYAEGFPLETPLQPGSSSLTGMSRPGELAASLV